MNDLIATTGTTVKGLGSSSKGPRSVAVVVKRKPMSAEQKLKCERKLTEAQQYSELGIKGGCNGM